MAKTPTKEQFEFKDQKVIFVFFVAFFLSFTGIPVI